MNRVWSITAFAVVFALTLLAEPARATEAPDDALGTWRLVLEEQRFGVQAQVYERDDRRADVCQAVVLRTSGAGSTGQHDIPDSVELKATDLENLAACTTWKRKQPIVDVFDGSLLGQPVRYVSGKLRSQRVRPEFKFSGTRNLLATSSGTTFLLLFKTGRPNTIVGSSGDPGEKVVCEIEWPDPLLPVTLCR